MIRAADLPEALKDAFIDALQAWSEAEGSLFKLYCGLIGATDRDRAWEVFSGMQARDQGKAVVLLAGERLGDAEARARITRLGERWRTLAAKRNHIVHGWWTSTEVDEDQVLYLRIYDGRRLLARPRDWTEDDALRGEKSARREGSRTSSP